MTSANDGSPFEPANFFSALTCTEKKFAGSSGDPTFADVMGVHPLALAGTPRPWDEYCDAFAE